MKFSLFGFPVHVRATFWLTPLLLAMPSRFDASSLRVLAAWTFVAFVSVLVHELGHALAMRRFGRSAAITLEALGGKTAWGVGPAVGAWANAFVSFAGPLAGFLFAAPFLALVVSGVVHLSKDPSRADVASLLVGLFLWANVGWGVLNLLPILPFDGGRVVQSVLTALFGLTGAKVARGVSLLTAAVLGVLALRAGMYWGAFLAFMGVQQTLREPLSSDGVVPALRVATPTELAANDAAREAWEALWNGRADHAERVIVRALGEVPSTETAVRTALTSILAWVHLDRGEDDRAAAVVATLPPDDVSPLLAARLRYAQGDQDAALAVLREVHASDPSPHSAAVLAGVLLERGLDAEVPKLLETTGPEPLPPFVHVKLSGALFYRRSFEHALTIDRAAWRAFRLPTFAHNAACALAQLGRADDAIELLGEAAREGAVDPELLRADPDLEPLRADPRFADIVARGEPARVEGRKRSMRTLAAATVVAILVILWVAWSKSR